MLGECDIFYPLQTKIADWYPTKPPPPPDPVEDDDEEEEEQQNVLPANVGPIPPNNAPIPPADQANGNWWINIIWITFACSRLIKFFAFQAIPAAQSDATAAPFLPTPANVPNDGNRLPTDQEIGIQPGSTLVSDPNFNTGSHPGEVYVDNKEKSGKNPPRRYFNEYSKYQSSYHPYYNPHQQYPYFSVREVVDLEF